MSDVNAENDIIVGNAMKFCHFGPITGPRNFLPDCPVLSELLFTA